MSLDRVHILSSDLFELPLPDGHRFPVRKYRQLRRAIEDEGLAVDLEPPAATWEQLARVHDPGYLERVRRGTLGRLEARRIGLPWSDAMVERSRRSCGATVRACHAALDHGLAVYLAGGTHHAFADRGEGYCVFNDVAVAAAELLDQGAATRLVVVDLDVHQGNGTAALFSGDPRVFTFSVHGAGNFPFHKVPGDLDVALPDGTGDSAYLEALDSHLERVLDVARPDLVVYLAGADVYAGDRLGRLALSPAGIQARDRRVVEAVARRRLPLALLMGGGYAEPIEETVAIQRRTVLTVLSGLCGTPSP